MLKAKLISTFLILLTSVGHGQPSYPFLSVPKSAIVTIRTNVSLECAVNSTMPAYWNLITASDRSAKRVFLNNAILPQMQSRYKINNSRSGQYDLLMDSVDHEHAGRYVCKSYDSGTPATAELTVIDSHPVCGGNSTGTIENDTVWMWCEIKSSGFLIPEIKWTKGNTDLESSREVTNNAIVTTTKSLVLLKLRPEDDGVTLSSTTSFIRKDGSTANVPHYLHVWNHTLTVHYGVRNIIIQPHTSNILIGEQLMCYADGNPEPSYTWTHLNTSLIQTGSVLTLNDSSLSIGSLHVFVCTAENTVAGERNVISKTISMSIGAVPTNITVLPKASSFRYGDQLTCSADGTPEPNYIWTHSNQSYTGPILTLPRSLALGTTHVIVCTAENTVTGVRRTAVESIVFTIEDERNDGLFAFDTGILVILEGIIILILVVALISVAIKAGKARRNISPSSSQLKIASGGQAVDEETERRSRQQTQGPETYESDIPVPYGDMACCSPSAMQSETYCELDMFEQEDPKAKSQNSKNEIKRSNDVNSYEVMGKPGQGKPKTKLQNSKSETQRFDFVDTYEIMENLPRRAATQPAKYYEFHLLGQENPRAKSAMSTILEDKKQESQTTNPYQTFANRPAATLPSNTYCELNSKQKKAKTSK